MNAREYLAALRVEVESHEAVNHPLLARVAHIPFRKEDYKVFGLQHYALVGNFTKYLEILLQRAPDSQAKQWIAKVLVNEYGEGSDNMDHAELYRLYLRATGAEPGEELSTMLHPAVTGFIEEHVRICKEEPFLVGLGAIGPGHEWAIPRMFQLIVRGLRRAGFTQKEMLYFDLHMEQDIDHGAWLEEALARYADNAKAQEEIRRGSLLSLEARSRFWSGVQEKIVRWRQPKNIHLRGQARRDMGFKADEITLEVFRKTGPLKEEARA
jgi:pyrroloquinoline-quinone synthase